MNRCVNREAISIGILMVLVLSIGGGLTVVYSGEGYMVHELPFDMVITDAPGENYVLLGDTSPLGRLLKGFEKADLPPDEVALRDNLLYQLVYYTLEPAFKERNLSDDIDISKYAGYDPPVLLVGIYNPTTDKVNFTVILLEKYNSIQYAYNGVLKNVTYVSILYRILTPKSQLNGLNDIAANMTIVNTLDKIAAEVFNEPEIMEEHLIYIIGIPNGLTIVVRKPDPSIEEIKNWFTNIRKIIPEDIPVVTAFVSKNYLPYIPEPEYEDRDQVPVEPYQEEASLIKQYYIWLLIIGVLTVLTISIGLKLEIDISKGDFKDKKRARRDSNPGPSA